jgi:hypothetical protein
MADAMDRVRLATTLAFGQQVMLVNAFACDQHSAT